MRGCQCFARPVAGLIGIAFLGNVWGASWGKHRLWKDGRAEVAIYDSTRIVYGQVRSFREPLITVGEDFRVDTLVKADHPKKEKTIRVFKLNTIEKFETENYPYSYLGSVFVKASSLREVVKITVGSQEWCGNTFKIYKGDLKGMGGELSWNSYFDGEADQKLALLTNESHYFEDQLPLSLRALDFKGGVEKKIRLYSSLLTNRGGEPDPEEATLKILGEELIRSHAGSLKSWKVELKRPDGSDFYWFEKKYPHIMTRMKTHDGRTRILYARARWSYWDRRIPKPNVLN